MRDVYLIRSEYAQDVIPEAHTQSEEVPSYEAYFRTPTAGSGKSQCWKTLQRARGLQTPDMPVKVVDLNPKTMLTQDLYGYVNMATREWKDGLLSTIMRDLGAIPDEKPKVIFRECCHC